MEISSSLVGSTLKPHKAEIPWRAMTNYAAAINDNNSIYFDDTQDEEIIAHPVFPVAVTWPILSNLGEFIEAKDFPEEVLMTQVHYSEHLVLHRPITPDVQLTIAGEIVALLPHRSGTHAVIKLEASDRSNRPIFTEYIGAMLRGVECDEGKGEENLLTVPSPQSEGELLWEESIDIHPLAPYLYDGCTDIEFGIHTSPAFAQFVGLPGIILQGTATLAHAVREVVNREAEGLPQNIMEVSCRFTGMVLPGTQIQVRCIGQKEQGNHKDIFFEVLNSEDKKAIRHGYVKIKE